MPTAPLAAGRPQVNVNTVTAGLTDVLGNVVNGFNASFTTALYERGGAQVTAVTPADGLTQVSILARVTIHRAGDRADGGRTLTGSSGRCRWVGARGNGNRR